jgi:hypothetical protein
VLEHPLRPEKARRQRDRGDAVRSPLDALVAAATEMTKYVRSPEDLTSQMAAFLQTELGDPEFYEITLENSKRIVAGYRALLDDAVSARELRPCDTAQLANAVSSLSEGSMMAWAVFREGAAEAWVRRDLATLLDPYRRKRRTRR